jgi:hypothetical protein
MNLKPCETAAKESIMVIKGQIVKQESLNLQVSPSLQREKVIFGFVSVCLCNMQSFLFESKAAGQAIEATDLASWKIANGKRIGERVCVVFVQLRVASISYNVLGYFLFRT